LYWSLPLVRLFLDSSIILICFFYLLRYYCVGETGLRHHSDNLSTTINLQLPTAVILQNNHCSEQDHAYAERSRHILFRPLETFPPHDQVKFSRRILYVQTDSRDDMLEVLEWLDRRARLATLLHSNRVELTTSLDYTFEPYVTAKPIALITSIVT
jgi:hypothetical protein